MKWLNDEGYVRFRSSFNNLKSLLGISDLDFIMNPELAPYVDWIMNYLNTRLLVMPDDTYIKDYIYEIFDIYSYGCEDIINNNVMNLVQEIGIIPNDPNKEDTIPFVIDRFILSWTNILTSLVVRLKFQYSNILEKNLNPVCSCKGKDTHDMENWTSGVMDPDDEYEHYDYSKRNDDVIQEGIINKDYHCYNCINNYRR